MVKKAVVRYRAALFATVLAIASNKATHAMGSAVIMTTAPQRAASCPKASKNPTTAGTPNCAL